MYRNDTSFSTQLCPFRMSAIQPETREERNDAAKGWSNQSFQKRLLSNEKNNYLLVDVKRSTILMDTELQAADYVVVNVAAETQASAATDCNKCSRRTRKCTRAKEILRLLTFIPSMILLPACKFFRVGHPATMVVSQYAH